MNAKQVLSQKQKIILAFFISLILLGLAFDFFLTAIILLGILTYLYFINVAFSLYMSVKSVFSGEEIKVYKEDINSLDENELPKYTILCPLYHEANVLAQYVKNMADLDYPKDKLECLLLLEEDDKETIEKAKSLKLPRYFKIAIVPHSLPKTKPKACNVGLTMATGDYAVIYDAEDLPDRDQLKKAIYVFNNVNDERVACVQAKLNFYNPNYNFLTRMFTSEYTLWFDLILPGFQSIDAPIPLGGTSNHFKMEVLKKMNGWDPYNVTEDCDLGIRLRLENYKTVILDSTTWEEANCNLKNWLRQRSRWIKGYLQTFLVYSRKPILAIKQMGFINSIIFSLQTGFMPLTMLINPILWLTTFSYFAFRPYVGEFIEQLYPAAVLYPAVFCLVFGNFFVLYNYFLGASKRGLYKYTKYGLLMPVYWLLICLSGWIALLQLIYKPHFWEKTIHGLHNQGNLNV